MSVVLVTGGHGFTAQYLAPMLADAGYRVVRSGLSASAEPEYVQCDLTDPARVRRMIDTVAPDFVVHLAGLSFVGHSEPLDFYRVNTLGTEYLLEAIRGFGRSVRKVVVAGSANIYGAAGRSLTAEDVCPLPVNHYARSKLAQEHVARAYFDAIPLLVTRPFNYTGHGQSEDFVIPKLVRHFANRRATVKLGNIDVEREYSDVRDVARIYCRLLESDAEADIVQICSGRAVGLREIIGMLVELTGHEIEVVSDERLARRNEIPVLCGNPARLHDVIGPMERTPLRDTLAWMLDASTGASPAS